MQRFSMLRFTGQTWFIIISLVEVLAFKKIVRTSANFCSTPACSRTAFSFLQNMDQSVDPCDNFYDFACGNFTKNAVIPDDRPSAAFYSQLRDKVQRQLWTSIENDIMENDSRSFKLLESYYRVCMDEDQIEKTSEQEFLKILNQLGGWPVLDGDSWNETSFDWRSSMLQFRRTGFEFDQIVDVRVEKDTKNSSRRLVSLDQASLGIAQNYLSQGLNNTVVKAYFKYMVDFAELLGVDRAQAVDELSQSLNFEIELAKISLPPTQRRDETKLYNPMTINELQMKYSSKTTNGPSDYPNWLDYLNDLLPATLNKNSTVNVVVPSYLEALSGILQRTPRRVQANYLFWRVAESVATQLSERINRARREFMASTTGLQKKTPRWQDCTDEVNDLMSLAAGALYTRNWVERGTKDGATQLIDHIRQSFQKILREVSWMDNKTKISALEKLEQMVPLIAYPDEFLDIEKIDDYYRELQIYPESFLKSSLSISLFNLARINEQLNKPVNKTDWTTFGSAAIVNAFYSPPDNIMIFPAGILKEIFFDKDNPNYVNYAGIGSVMGHEMTHGFDDMGRLFDKDGNLLDWWGNSTKTEYLKRAQCIIDQYSNYTAKQVNLHLDGVNTQGENIADNGGMKEAYYAYEAWDQENGPEAQLPGLEAYTPRQTFWISNANIWCGKYRSEYLGDLIVTDPHSPSEFRVNGPMSNMPEFARDFNCPRGSPMNSVKKCAVW